MSSTETTGLPAACDLETAPGRFCDRPVEWFAISSDTPELWPGGSPGYASLAGFCCRSHADQEPHGTREQAERSFANVVDMAGDRDAVVAVWRELLACYPDPVNRVHLNG